MENYVQKGMLEKKGRARRSQPVLLCQSLEPLRFSLASRGGRVQFLVTGNPAALHAW